jgi:hypothetical protein
MPKGPKGEKRPANVIGNAVRVMRIARRNVGDDASGASGHSSNVMSATHESRTT